MGDPIDHGGIPIRLSIPAVPSRFGQPGESDIQAVLIPTYWRMTAHQAGEWIIRHVGVVPIKVHTTHDFQRFRVAHPSYFVRFITKTLDNGARIVIGFY